jgi:hypothetical protein
VNKAVFPKKLFDDLVEFLSGKAPKETGCFLLAHCFTTENGDDVFTVNRTLKPSQNSWNYEGEDGLEPSSSYINHSVLMAETNKAGLVFVHSHPNDLHPSKFSPIDEETNEKLLRNLGEILQNQPLGSIVFSRYGMYGVALNKEEIVKISEFRIVGKTYTKFTVSSDETEPQMFGSTFDRQVRAIGTSAQRKLQETTVSIVGVGGTGSAVAVQLARMGIKKIRFIDRDSIDESNVTRVYGSTFNDVGKPKVTVLKRHISRFSRTEIETLKIDITKNDIISRLADSDVIFGCTDNLTSRSILNDIAVQYYIPLIDVGCRIDLNEDHSINQALAKVEVVTPDGACLWCSGALDGNVILQESFSTEEKKRLADEGYYESVEKQPSIVSITTLAATIAVNKFLKLLNALGDEYSSRTQVEVNEEFMISDSPEIKAECICQKRRGLGESRNII